MNVLETERLVMRPIGENDLEDLARLYAEPEVMRFVGQGVPLDRDQTKLKLERMLDHWQRHESGIWAMIHRELGVFVGRVGIGNFHETGEMELAYTLAKPWWGHGYASEAAKASIDYGFMCLNLPRIVAYSRPENLASLRVMMKIGMTFECETEYLGKSAVKYGINKPQASRRA